QLIEVFGPRTLKPSIAQKKLDYFALPGPQLACERIHIAPSQGPQPAPVPSHKRTGVFGRRARLKRLAGTRDNRIYAAFSGEQRSGQPRKQRGVGHFRVPADRPTNLTLRESVCVKRRESSRDENSVLHHPLG